MTEQQLEIGKTILELIKTTEKALKSLDDWRESTRGDSTSSSSVEYERDGNHCLSINSNLNGGGPGMNLYRRTGNTDLLKVIKAELERQLAKFKADFDNL